MKADQSAATSVGREGATSIGREGVYALAALAAGLAAAGVVLIVAGTSATSVGRYAAPPEILPGVALVHLGALAASVLTAIPQPHLASLAALRQHISRGRDGTGGQAKLALFLMLAALQVAMSLVEPGSSSHVDYSVSLAGNIAMSITGAAAFFGWWASRLISRRSDSGGMRLEVDRARTPTTTEGERITSPPS